ncbi:uncharacterized protein LOC131148516 isoform X6 [Malania oleifera]|uniref:uncharacterized protein LOC131148516 isoform X6 n=1 Tax=Malania oleifera TaxID=397392 RepID=UPI0025ADCDA3|nr:uncharacterized protein LOC131148516 isoform X6 [Malania oleifera]
MILLEPPIIFTTPAKLSSRRPFLTSAAVRCSSITKPECSAKASFKCSCKKNGKSGDDFESFSVLVSDIPWDDGSTWSTMALYFFSLHIPLSFGALSLVARMLHQTILDLQTEALSLLVIETLELIGALLLLKCTAKPQFKLVSFFKVDKSSKERNWLMASAIGFGILILFVFLTSLLADIIIGPKGHEFQNCSRFCKSARGHELLYADTMSRLITVVESVRLYIRGCKISPVLSFWSLMGVSYTVLDTISLWGFGYCRVSGA